MNSFQVEMKAKAADTTTPHEGKVMPEHPGGNHLRRRLLELVGKASIKPFSSHMYGSVKDRLRIDSPEGVASSVVAAMLLKKDQ